MACCEHWFEAYETSWITSREDGKDYISATKPDDHLFLSKVGFRTWNKDENCLQLKLQWSFKYLIIGATIRVYWKLEDARVVKPHLPEDIFYHFLECKRVSHKVLRPLENLKDLTHRWAGKMVTRQWGVQLSGTREKGNESRPDSPYTPKQNGFAEVMNKISSPSSRENV